MKIQININGKNINAEISEEDAKVLGMVDKRPRTGYERVEKDSMYFYNDAIGDTNEVTDYKDMVDQEYYDSGNYYNNEMIARNNARADLLFQRLRQWQAANDTFLSVSDWEDEDLPKYNIGYNYVLDVPCARIDSCCRSLNSIYFSKEDKAIEAIRAFKSDIIWYYTEYIQRLDEIKND